MVSEKRKFNPAWISVVLLVIVTIGGWAFSLQSNKFEVDSLKENFKLHCVNQETGSRELAIALKEFTVKTTELATEVKNLKETVADLKQEIRRDR
jgi:hypothetical protein